MTALRTEEKEEIFWEKVEETDRTEKKNDFLSKSGRSLFLITSVVFWSVHTIRKQTV